MQHEQISMTDILIRTHSQLERQGPGSPEMTLRALSFLDNTDGISRTADLGCGSGGQTMVLAQHISGSIAGVDQSADFISIFNDNAAKLKLEGRVKGIVGSMENLPFQKEELDLIWSEGAIDSIGFETGLNHWRGFLRKDGYIAVTCPSWFTDTRPAEIERFWADAGSFPDTPGHNISVMQKSGYRLAAAFTLPEECWTDNYFIPRAEAEKALSEKYSGNKTVKEYMESSEYESELYKKYSRYYGYIFYIGRKT